MLSKNILLCHDLLIENIYCVPFLFWMCVYIYTYIVFMILFDLLHSSHSNAAKFCNDFFIMKIVSQIVLKVCVNCN